ncbi:inactive hydroxysteroid dehydrogenase-like protein 1 isoform X1 [Varroa jacobsoni]|uniref:inactive hydroxysteroid dehydrogenase-like protein 1 isoform X1 n=1 Tax=Varroa jacobsoni TaxID=62625 RepID=UPI000BF8AAB5|nr:inactive hydroxysteroid dehydrogenase-like protein 1 isoform X1 [Varroa jacobsoni]
MSAQQSPVYNRLKMAAVDSAFFLIQEMGITFSRYRNYLALIGLIYCSKLGCAVTSRLYEALKVHVVARLWKADLKKYGQWALVTGCTDGIGREYARQLASRGLNIILLSRNQAKLQATASELERDYQVQTHIIVADLSQGREVYASIAEQLGNKEIGILVNNAGVMYDQPSRFCNVPEKKLIESVNINMMAVVMLTYIVLPQMLQRKRGIVINLSSISGFYPLPLMAVYSASKVFVDWFSMALDVEYRSQGIIVQSLIPSYVSTNLVRFSNFLSKPSFIVPDAKRFVSSALDTITYSKRTTGFWSHGLQYWAMEHTPQWVWNINSNLMFRAIDSSKEKKF